MRDGADFETLWQGFVPKLQHFLLAKMKEVLIREGSLLHTDGTTPAATSGAAPVLRSNWEGRVFINADRMYRHNLMRVNYTTYDVRRAQDVIHPSTSHCNIMLLDQASDSGSTAGENHPYLYARVLGIYHVNATYIGPGMVDYRSHRIDFLWVRWYRHLSKHSQASQQASLSLDHVCFPPIGEQDSFGFVDPDDVLRCCHVIPHFAQGLQHSDGRGISICAQDQSDWKSYYINRCVNGNDY
jgi:hypothetical protein